MALPKAKQDLTEATLSALPAPFDGAWAKAAQDEARVRLAALGMPVRRDEYWKFTNPAAYTTEAAEFATSTDTLDVFDAAKPLTITFVDGVLDADASDDMMLEGVTIETLVDAADVDLHWAKGLYGVLENAANTAPAKDGAALYRSVPRPLAALNTAAARDGLVIRVSGAASRPIRISYRSNGGDAMIHHVIKVDEGASLTLLEEGTAGARSNVMLEVDIADKAAFHHLRMQEPVADRHTLTNTFARLGNESTFKSFGLTAQGVLTRNETIMELTGDDAVAHVAGACLGDGNVHHDDTVYITHDAVNCESRQVFKKVLRNGAVGVFQGKILVQPHAQKTDGYQISQSLLLDDDSQFLAKPELEIYADDVACSHGSTSGAIDEAALFYLRSRGVPHAEAINLLTLSFLAEALEEIDDEALAEMVQTRLEQWLRA
ncbi:SufB/SufD family protein [Shimia ponticola]|uniref:SufB/SufD family protein n=1 Tax=Shimia ponticola TaxID=2582893 RepID=UPI0011BE651F|nr:SufD family Fe-S cluster assembly protein [Shimia ponticola]